ncbi:hypothetical protein PA598K_06813 [Paenibacillus sp. 598K]|uniref:YheC/YheD family endospore coat-associated protein n=1 Tax=Paenibacillus sp. 598K TaxID=1117987 RepID=UPI000FFA68E4|nr:YheC/YheD family protein [Paenibacillus sp. 598K]GBF78202.1 hypothetical protein PA598K_06813 [Paenibacillus sp. 598K]
MQSIVGILINASAHRSLVAGTPCKEKFEYYEQAAREHGVVPCFFRLGDLRRDGTVLAYTQRDGRYRRIALPIPDVIHNRAIHQGGRAAAKLAQLRRQGKRLFNGWNRYSKLELHRLLMLEPQLRAHLPETLQADADTVREMQRSHDTLILKPANSSVGRGVMKLERSAAGWQLTRRLRSGWRTEPCNDELPRRIRALLRAETYLIQQRLPLATYEGRPFDLRVSAQRDRSGDWTITGIAAKVAPPGSPVTNIARGGSVYQLDEVLAHLSAERFAQVQSAIATFCLSAATHLSRHLPGLADLGFDIGLTTDGFPMFIECNGRDLRVSFPKAGLTDAWYRSYANPIGYARHLLDQLRARGS